MELEALIVNAKVYNSYLKKFIEANVGLTGGKFVYIGPLNDNSFQVKEVIDARGNYMIPGLIDIHLHIESTMVTPESFSYGLIKNGVTTVVADPHEMANIFGVEGIQEMIKAGRRCVADILTGIPSSVPSTSRELETTGGEIGIEEIDQLLQAYREDIACLGEVMNYYEVINDPRGRMNTMLAHIKDKYPELVIEGHCPNLMDLDLTKFILSGVDSDHTHQTVAGMEERIRNGMFIEIQEKSMSSEVINYLIEHDVSEHFCFVTDDVMPDSFVEKGHLNFLLKKAINMGMEPEKAIYACTYTPSQRMKLTDRGCIAPNRIADFALLSDLHDVVIEQVYKNGKKAYDKKEEYIQPSQQHVFPQKFYHSVKLSRLTRDDFVIRAPIEEGSITCRVMMVSNGTTFTKEFVHELPVENGVVNYEASPYCFVGVFERHGLNGDRGVGLVGGNVIKRGAVATTYAHDHHNLLVIGKNITDMIVAANEVINHQGGYCTVDNGRILSSFKLPVGGVLSDLPLEHVAVKVKELRESLIDLGYEHYNPIMSLSTICLPVSPELKVTDRGLIDVNNSKIVDLFIH